MSQKHLKDPVARQSRQLSGRTPSRSQRRLLWLSHARRMDPERTAKELQYGELAVATRSVGRPRLLQRRLQERPKAVWQRHHQPKGHCWRWRCLNVSRHKRYEDGWVSWANYCEPKKSKKTKRKEREASSSFAPSEVGTPTEEWPSTATSENVVQIDPRPCTTVLRDRRMGIIINDDYFVLVRFLNFLGWSLLVVNASKR